MKIIVWILAGIAAGWTAWSYFSTSGTQEPRYRVSEKKRKYELRRYDPYVVAEIDVKGSYDEAVNKGFGALFSYIAGNNTKQGKIPMTAPVTETIAMTAPVTERAVGGDVHTVAFVMPSSSTLETLPRPNDPAIRLRAVPARTVAAMRFSWYPSSRRMEQKKKELLADLRNDHIASTAQPESALYNPPFTIPFMMRDEVLVEVGR